MQLFSSRPEPSCSASPPPNGTVRSRTRAMVQCALLVAISIVLTHLLTISTPILRFNLGGVPILLAGVLFGPVGGGIVGMLADLIGGTLAGYSINPLITLGTSLTGFVMGLCYHALPLPSQKMRICLGVLLGNLIGSVIVNSLALRIYYGYAWSVLALRIPNNIIVGALECVVLCYLCGNAMLMKVLARR